MGYLKDVYMPKGNYVRINGQPLLLDFGPQTFTSPNDWQRVFEPFGNNKPTFLTLWYQQQQAEGSAAGEYPWIYSGKIVNKKEDSQMHFSCTSYILHNVKTKPIYFDLT